MDIESMAVAVNDENWLIFKHGAAEDGSRDSGVLVASAFGKIGRDAHREATKKYHRHLSQGGPIGEAVTAEHNAFVAAKLVQRAKNMRAGGEPLKTDFASLFTLFRQEKYMFLRDPIITFSSNPANFPDSSSAVGVYQPAEDEEAIKNSETPSATTSAEGKGENA